ncbi:hypothetical protein FNYG_08889 [Fusarium nygamai]|uniref:Uncharacterized protein n=1 Tax=Gibberella nygamai TaxID=42673 RepID=A0A2K0W6B4_GIBNY|nr:hypothetical protein FNYG_08889 [Fusarium nygamai]
MDGLPENNEEPISQEFLDKWAAKGKAKEIFEHSPPPWCLAEEESKVENVSVWTKHPDSITEEILDEDDDIPMSEEEEDRGEDTDHRLSTDNPTIHVHGGGKAAIE